MTGMDEARRISLSSTRWRNLALVILVAATVSGVAWLRLNNSALGLSPEIVAFGPNPVVHNQPFNQQPSGESAIWVKLNKQAEEDFVLVLDGHELATVVAGDLLTAAVPPTLFSKPGSLQLWVEATRQGDKVHSKPVAFKVN